MVSSNLKLLFYGLLIGILSSFYPRLAELLPISITSKLPFLPPPPPQQGTWRQSQQYQHSIPISPNHDPYDLKGPMEEKFRRLNSQVESDMKDAERRRLKEEKLEREELERRTEIAGEENRVHTHMPVYFLEMPPTESLLDKYSELAVTYARIGREIFDTVKPTSIVLFSPIAQTIPHPVINTSPLTPLLHSLSNPTSPPSLPVQGNPSLSQSLIISLAQAGVISTQLARGLDPISWIALAALMGDRKVKEDVKVVQVSLGTSGDAGTDEWEVLGKSIGESHDVRDGGVVLIGLGSIGALKGKKTKGSKLSPTSLKALTDILTSHTSHPRTLLLSKFIAPISKLDKLPLELRALFAIVGAAGESEGERVDGSGLAWRFGWVPMRRE